MRRTDCPVDADRPVCVRPCGRVPGMFAHTIQNWWWTASPAAH
ncbi:trp operon leader peptide [Streptomyces sp. NPDC004596]